MKELQELLELRKKADDCNDPECLAPTMECEHGFKFSERCDDLIPAILSHVEALERENAELKAEHKKALDDLLVQATHQLQQLSALREFVRDAVKLIEAVCRYPCTFCSHAKNGFHTNTCESKLFLERAEQILKEEESMSLYEDVEIPCEIFGCGPACLDIHKKKAKIDIHPKIRKILKHLLENAFPEGEGCLVCDEAYKALRR